MNPYWIVGFTDGDGSWVISLYKDYRVPLGYGITFKFIISQRSNDKNILIKIKDYFKLGYIYSRKTDNCSTYVVSNKILLQSSIIPFFQTYLLKTVKQYNLNLFISVLSLTPIKSYEKLNEIKEKLKLMNKHKQYLTKIENLDPWWVTGFIDAEGCFLISFYNKKNYKLGIKVVPRLLITQHNENKAVLQSLKQFFNCGRIYNKGNNCLGFEIEGFKNISSLVLSHFNNYPLQTSKKDDFEIFCKILNKMENKEHLIEKGLIEIKELKDKMNIGKLAGNELSSLEDTYTFPQRL